MKKNNNNDDDQGKGKVRTKKVLKYAQIKTFIFLPSPLLSLTFPLKMKK